MSEHEPQNLADEISDVVEAANAAAAADRKAETDARIDAISAQIDALSGAMQVTLGNTEELLDEAKKPPSKSGFSDMENKIAFIADEVAAIAAATGIGEQIETARRDGPIWKDPVIAGLVIAGALGLASGYFLFGGKNTNQIGAEIYGSSENAAMSAYAWSQQGSKLRNCLKESLEKQMPIACQLTFDARKPMKN